MANDTMQAQAVWFDKPGVAVVRTEDVPAPDRGQVRVQAIASAISHGTERLVYRGDVPDDLPLDLPTLAGSFAFPIKYGYAMIGRVRDVGSGVTDLAIGDIIFALHPHQTVFNISATLATRLPPAIDPLLGVFTANVETALNIVHDTPIRFGETALIFGQGIVGLLVAQVIRLAGARRVLVVEPSSFRQMIARQVGADAVLMPGEDLAERVRQVNNGRNADVVIEVSGAGAALQAAIDVVAQDGTVVVASWYGTKPITLMLGGHFHRGRVRIHSSQVGQLNPELGRRWDYARRLEAVLDLLPRLRLSQLITHHIPFENAPAAYHLVDQQPDTIGQVVLVYDNTIS